MNDKTRAVFDLLGVEPGEVFNLTEVPSGDYKLTEDLRLMYKDNEGRWNDTASSTNILSFIKGTLEIKKRPFVPQNGEIYWFIEPSGKAEEVRSDKRYAFTWYNIRLGNCYKTGKEALDNKEKWVEFFSKTERIELE